MAPYRNYTEYLRIPSLGSSCGPLIPWKRCLRRLSIWWREGRRACGRSKSTKPTSTQGQRVFITNVKGTFFGMSESEEASSLVQGSVPGRRARAGPFLMLTMGMHRKIVLRRNRGTFFRFAQISGVCGNRLLRALID